MVIERFHNNDVAPVGDRFRTSGRMLPEGVTYQASWLDHAGSQCFQLVDAPSVELMSAWISRWNDLADFELIPVLTSAEFWEARRT